MVVMYTMGPILQALNDNKIREKVGAGNQFMLYFQYRPSASNRKTNHICNLWSWHNRCKSKYTTTIYLTISSSYMATVQKIHILISCQNHNMHCQHCLLFEYRFHLNIGLAYTSNAQVKTMETFTTLKKPRRQFWNTLPIMVIIDW